jgi:hypothetical protein
MIYLGVSKRFETCSVEHQPMAVRECRRWLVAGNVATQYAKGVVLYTPPFYVFVNIGLMMAIGAKTSSQ